MTLVETAYSLMYRFQVKVFTNDGVNFRIGIDDIKAIALHYTTTF